MKYGLAFGSSIATEGDQALQLCQLAERLGFESIWGGEHVIMPERDRIPVPVHGGRQGSGGPRDTDSRPVDLAGLRRCGRSDLAARYVHPDRAAEEPVDPRQRTRHPRSPVERQGRTRPRCRLDAGGVRRARRAVGTPRCPQRRVHRGDANVVERCGGGIPRRVRRLSSRHVQPTADTGIDPDPRRR